MKFCWFRHEWIEKRRHFTPPVKGWQGAFSEGTVLKLANGYTIITFSCYRCGAWKTEEVDGDATK